MERINDMLNDWTDSYTKEYGEKSSYKIAMTIAQSIHTKKLNRMSIEQKGVPTSEHFRICTRSNLSMAFAKRHKITCGAVLLLSQWIELVNYDYEIAGEDQLIEIFKEIIN